jgi:hypothetical protein
MSQMPLDGPLIDNAQQIAMSDDSPLGSSVNLMTADKNQFMDDVLDILIRSGGGLWALSVLSMFHLWVLHGQSCQPTSGRIRPARLPLAPLLPPL